jgi:2-polyprenyl-3-methyl-5-hydroxy-6-metoxy-1,4-benzoquinol methylase
MPAHDERLDEALAWLRHVESMHEDVARRELRDRMRRDARAARTELRLPRPWPSMPDGARRMFDSDGEIVRLRRIVDLVGPDARILDVGCGPGVVGGALALHDRPAAYLGIDLSEPKIASAREMAATNRLADRLRFDVGDAAELPEHTIAELAPDTVLILEVLEHLEEPADVLASIAQLVSDDARIIFSVPILGRIEACWGHRTLFGAGAIVGLADACDLRLLDVEEIHNTWALATVGRQPTRHVAPAGTSPIAIRHVSPSAVRADVASAARHRQPPRLVVPIGPGQASRTRSSQPSRIATARGSCRNRCPAPESRRARRPRGPGRAGGRRSSGRSRRPRRA